MTSERIPMVSFPLLFGSRTSFTRTTRAVYGAAIHTGAWLAISWLVILVAGEAPARYAYGIICGWWASLYLGYVCGVKVGAAVPGFLIYCTYGLIAFAFGWQSFYHAVPDTLDVSFVGAVVVRALAFTSPILVNGLVLRAREGWSRWPRKRRYSAALLLSGAVLSPAVPAVHFGRSCGGGDGENLTPGAPQEGVDRLVARKHSDVA